MTLDKKVTFDLSGLIPEARNIASEVAAIYWKHTQPWFVGLVCFGSAVKGGLIPGASDIDFHLDLEDAAFTATDVLRLDIALAIQADLAQINPAPFRYIDGGAETGPATRRPYRPHSRRLSSHGRSIAGCRGNGGASASPSALVFGKDRSLASVCE